VSSNPPSKTPRLNISDSALFRIQQNIAGTLDDVLGVFQGNHGSAIISWGTGTPTFSAVAGSLYLNLTPGTVVPTLWLKQTASTSPVWTAITDNATTTVNLAALTAEVNTLNTDVSNLTTEVNTLNTEVTTLTADISTLTAEVSTLTAEVSTLTAEVSTLTTEVNTLNTEVSTLNSEVTTLTGAVATLQVTQRAIVFSLIAPQMVGAGSGNPITVSLQPITPGGTNEGSPAEIVYQPWSGSIVALSHTLIGNAGTPGPGTGGVQSGNAQVIVYKNGMATNAVATLSATIPITNTQTYAPGTYTFNAGDVLELWAQSTSCYRSSSSPWASNTRATLWVQYNVS